MGPANARKTAPSDEGPSGVPPHELRRRSVGLGFAAALALGAAAIGGVIGGAMALLLDGDDATEVDAARDF
jgi:hypothetical protein